MNNIVCPYKPCGENQNCIGCIHDPQQRLMTKEQFNEECWRLSCANCAHRNREVGNTIESHCKRIDGIDTAITGLSTSQIAKDILCSDFEPDDIKKWMYRHWQPEFLPLPEENKYVPLRIKDDVTHYAVAYTDFYHNTFKNDDGSLKWVFKMYRNKDNKRIVEYPDGSKEYFNPRDGMKQNGRYTKEQLLYFYPWWNSKRKNDVVGVTYMDIPLIHWDENSYKAWQKLTSTESSTEAVEAFMYANYGDYDIYSSHLLGRVCISKSGDVLCGDINVKYRGRTYSILLNMMYGFDALDIIHIGSNIDTGFSNSGSSIGSPSRNVRELDKDAIEAIINNPMSDYGQGCQKFMNAVRELYHKDENNHILERGAIA